MARVGGLAAAGVAGYAWPRAATAATSAPTPASPAAPSAAPGVLHFVSREDLTPPAITIAHARRQPAPQPADPPYIFVAAAGYPHTGPGEPGLMILTRGGRLVWYSPVQEIDIASGKVLFEWSSLDHVPVTETYIPFSGGTTAAPFDYLHINSIAIAPDGDLLVSGRNTSAVYKVARPGGEVTWRLGGKQSSFQMGPGATFWWQHHVRPQGANVLSIFDDGASPAKEAQSRAILLDLDTTAMRATLTQAYTHPAGLLAANQGSMQVLPDGRVLVGWGNLPYFSEFAADGTRLLDGQFPVGDQSYRAFTGDWTGHPADKPAAAAHPNPAGGSTVYASWNGATQLDSWTVCAGSTAAGLKQVGSQEHTGFETAITVNTAGPYFAVTAHDADGHVLGRSATVRLTAS